jgi:cyclophilin family peptidyl-prolyl cis-trans isomerase/HEAT repeat protein
MPKRILLAISILILTFCSACVPESKKLLTKVEINVDDPVFQKIMNFEYSERADSLLPYLSHEDPTYRYLASKSFASLQDEAALDSLYSLLDDPVIKVRAMAAYAIGQTGQKESEEALIRAFRQRDTMSVDNSANGAILEAIGKLGNDKLAALLATSRGYRDSDTLLLRGKMMSLYRFALRGIHDESVINYLLETVRNTRLDPITRLYAAHSMARIADLNIDKIKFQLAEALTEENNKDVKMALALVLRHTDNEEIQQTLLDELKNETDSRVKINIIKALASYSYIESAELITQLLKDEDINVARQAAMFLYSNGIKEDVSYYRQIGRDGVPWQVQAEILKATTKLLPYYYSNTLNSVRWEVQQLIKEETDPLIIINYLKALSHDPAAYEWIISYIKDLEDESIKTAGIEVLGNILSDENFNGTFQSYSNYHRGKILDFLKSEMEASSDQGILGMSAEIIATRSSYLSEMIDSTEFLFDARSRLDNPGNIESIHAIERAIAAVRGVNNPDYTDIAQSRTVDWELLNGYNTNTKVIIKTNRGACTIDLYMADCPGTVLNFLELSASNYYDGKRFHRVVPNFVIQTGSPRADNYGGTDYVINSELGPKYYDGAAYIGMASAGKNTESAQWFITHSPTPHLDGKYTIFGKVIEGVDVIQSIYPGDTIEDVIISNLQN